MYQSNMHYFYENCYFSDGHLKLYSVPQEKQLQSANISNMVGSLVLPAAKSLQLLVFVHVAGTWRTCVLVARHVY